MKRPPRFPRVDELPDGPRARRFLVAAFAFFALAVLAGGWLRVGMAWPAVLDGIAPFNLRNAHSHVAYFGWLSLAVEKTPPLELKLHRALVAAGNSSEADTMLRTMLAAHPDDPGLRSYAGERAVAGRHWAEAIGHYQAVLAKQPQNAVAMNNLAWAMHQTGDPKALEFAEKAYLAAPKSPAVLDTLGVILVARGDAARAVPLLRQAIAASPKAPELRLHLAEALLKTGDRTAARSELETVLRDAPSGRVAEAAQALQKQL